MNFTTTEQSSKYEHLEKMSVQELLANINQEDKTVPDAVEQALPQIETLVNQIAKMKLGGSFTLVLELRTIRNGRVRMSSYFGVPFDLVELLLVVT
jgi:N-acetylmuramic acid 6-phosphate etherase